MPLSGNDKALGMLGLCQKAGGVLSGVEACVNAVRKGKARLALIDADASDNTKKAVGDACRHAGAALRELPAGALESAIGKSGRMAAAIVHDQFAARIISLLDQQRDCGGACSQ